jgi:SAM-dependent methyltransferase
MKKTEEKNELSKKESLEFAAVGLACHALCLIQYVGILDILKNEGQFRIEGLQKYKNLPLIRAALVTLVGAKVLVLSNATYVLTDLGQALIKNIGAIILPFVGYRDLLARQFDLLEKPASWKDSDIDYPAIALSSIEFGLLDLDPILLNIFRFIKPQGTICDLGCGTGEKLAKICKAVNAAGLGIEKNLDVINESKIFIKDCPRIEIVQGDIVNLKEIWEDVEVAMISFVYHDINPLNRCLKFLNSLHKHFPRLRCLVIADIVSLSEGLPSIMPGFDYVHGLQGIIPRSYEETLETFAKADFNILNEVAVPNMPNTFVWVLAPQRKVKK